MRRRDRLSIRMTRLLFLITVLLATIAESMKLGLIGQPCRLNDKKPCVLPNSQCIEGICMCSSFYKFINGSCITDKSKTLGKKCHGGGDCPGEGEFCSSFSICMCLSTHVDVGTQCKPVIYPGQFGCEDSLQCSKGFPGAECDVSRVCVCPHGMIVSQQTCIPNNQKNSTRSAIIHDLMQHNVIMSDHRISRTDFRGNFFRRRTSEHATSSTYQLEPDSVCMYDNQCSGYPLAICDSVCKCVKGSLNTGSTCIASTSALQSTVACPAGQIYVREAGVCMTVQHPGEPCQYSQQCSAVEPGAYCLKMRCECVYGMKKSSNGCTFVNNNCKQRGHIFISELGECREVIPPGGQGCSHNLQCSGAYPDATCFMQTCTCPPNLPAAVDGTCGRACPDGQVYSGVTGECLPIVQPGEACLYSPQCQKVFGGMVCDKNVCRCPNGLVFDGSRCANNCPPTQPLNQNDICVTQCSSGLVESEGECLRKVEIGQPCATNLQCQFGSFCQGGSCLCPPGFYVTDGQCRAVESEPNGSCANNEKCTKGSVCYNGRCTCPRNHELVNGHCQPNRAVPIGSACVRVGVTCDGGSTCVAGVCVCPLGTTPRNGVCVRITTAKPGESCADGQECTDGTTCDEETRRCQCVNPTQMVIGERCVDRLRSHPGYGCTMGELCVGNSVCINGKCECPTGKVEINKICVEPMTAKIGDTCGRSYICSGGSYCNSESMTCACRKGQKEVRGECKHVQIVYPGERCGDVTNRCAGGSYCVHGRCECPFNMNVVDRKCVVQQKAAPGEPCQENTICTGGSVCRSKVCSCLNDMVIREKTCSHRRKVHIGDSCEPVVDQCMGNSTCTEGKCECPPGQVNSNHVCAPPKNVSPGYLCNPEDICIGQSVCVRGVCQCEPGYKLTKSSCVKVKNGIEGTSCSHTDDCMNNLACIEGACGCSEEMYAKNGRCHHFVVLGQACTNDDRCLNKDAQCVEGKCDCVNGLINVNEECVAPIVTPVEPESSSQVAVSQVSSSQSRSGLIGHYCQLDHHCKVVHSVCQRSVCICREGYRIFGSTQCIPRRRTEARPIVEMIVPPLSSCAHGEVCSSNSECVHGVCFCKEDYTLFQGKCQSIKSIEHIKSNGTSNETTTVRNQTPTRLEVKLTTEPTTTSQSLTSPSWFKLVKPGYPCNNSTFCTSCSVCIDGFCVCPEGLELHNERCVSQYDAQRCMASNQCPAGANCINGECKCKPGLGLSRLGFCIPINYADPGRSCAHGEKCRGDSFCIDGMCACNSPLVLHENKCVKSSREKRYIRDIYSRNRVKSTPRRKSRLGEFCQHDNHCELSKKCVNNYCECGSSSFVQSGNNCVPRQSIIKAIANPGDPCRSAICANGSNCVKSVCKCPNETFLLNNRCVSSEARIGAPCGISATCRTGSQCISSYCQCPSSYDAIKDECDPPLTLSARPKSMPAPNVLQSNLAASKCPIGYELVNGVCVNSDTMTIIQLAEPGEPCEDGRIMCTGNSVCANSLCICPGGEVVRNATCISVSSFSAPGEQCDIDETICTGDSTCVDGVCKCSFGKGAIAGKCTVLSSSSVVVCGQIQCGAHQICVDNRCQCKMGFYIPSTCTAPICDCVEQTRQIQSISIVPFFGLPGQMCDMRPGATMCRNSAICVSNYCSCPPNMSLNGNVCIQIQNEALPGQSCSATGVICSGGSKCINNICKCDPGFMAIMDKCTVHVQISAGTAFDLMPGQKCDPQCGNQQQCLQRCTGGSTCINFLCTCPAGSVVFNNICTPENSMSRTASPGDQCDMNVICIGGASCILGTCTCDLGYTPSNDKSSCVMINRMTIRSRSYPTKPCKFDTDCTGGSLCVEKKCACPIGNDMVNGNCQLTNQPGSRCHTSHCTKGAECHNGYCVCASSGYSNATLDCVPSDDSFTKILYPGSKCDKSKTCLNSTVCHLGYCVHLTDDIDKSIMENMQSFGETKDKNIVREANIALNMLKECPTDGSCRLPDCFCTKSGKQPPLNVDIKKIPQMVMLTFDDPVTDRIINTLKALFSGKIRNPNGCPIRGTFFISHQWNNYDQSQWLYSKGNELAVNSITREILANRTKERWSQEQNGMKNTLAEYSYADKKNIIGARAPGHLIGGDNQMEILKDNGFLYDNSIIVNGQYWPQTLDYKMAWDGTNTPTKSHKGLWEIPVQMVQGNDGMWYNTLSMAIKPSDSRVSVKQMLMRNFMQNYKSNRAPFVLTLSTEFLTYLPDNGAILALNDFLSEIVQRTDVYIVTGSQLIDWMKKPMDIDSLKHLPSWQCNFKMNDHVQPCESPSICSYSGRQPGQVAHSFRICGSCPKKYTWI